MLVSVQVCLLLWCFCYAGLVFFGEDWCLKSRRDFIFWKSNDQGIAHDSKTWILSTFKNPILSKPKGPIFNGQWHPTGSVWKVTKSVNNLVTENLTFQTGPVGFHWMATDWFSFEIGLLERKRIHAFKSWEPWSRFQTRKHLLSLC